MEASTSGTYPCPPHCELLESVEATFHDVEYIVSVSTIGDDVLRVDVEQKSDASRWQGNFSSRHIEDITAKTGNFKKMPVFSKMLRAALRQETDTVFVDLLTYADLEALKARRSGGADEPPLSSTIPPNNKRYLILTYAAEFDRVHYPLPLAYDEAPDPAHLRSIIAKLRQKLDQVKGPPGGRRNDISAELRRLREENTALRQQLSRGEGARSLSGEVEQLNSELKETHQELRLASKEREVAQQRAAAAEAELQHERGLHRRLLRRHAKELADAQDDAARAKEVAKELRLRCNELIRASSDSMRRAGRPLFPGSPSFAAKPNYPRRAAPDPRREVRGSGLHSGGPRPPMAQPRSLSREASPLHSRGSSPTAARSVASSHGTRDTARPRSAPPRPRFDPTEFVRQKRQRETEALARLGRYPTPPPRSRAASLSPSRTPSKPPTGLQGASRVSSRASSVERVSQRRAEPASREQRIPFQQQPVPGPNRENISWPYAAQTTAYPPRDQRAMSPGRALQDVQARLNQYVASRAAPGTQPAPLAKVSYMQPAAPPIGVYPSLGQATAYPTAPPCPSADGPLGLMSQGGPPGAPFPPAPASGLLPSLPKSIFHDASADIADIDSRLHALQDFLRAAKAGAGAVPPLVS